MAAVISIKDSVQLYIGEGETLKLTDAIGNKASIGDIGGDGAEEIDVTSMESEAKEYELGYEDYGSFDVTQFLNSDEYAKMATLKESGTNIKWGVLINNKAGEKVLGLQGAGKVKGVKLTGLSVGSAVQVVTTVRCSGAVTSDFELPTA
jgi:hypothetical protein